VIYGVVAGYVLSRLLRPERYVVSPRAPLYALIGTAFYVVAVLVYRRVSVAGIPIAVFTMSEILEGIISTVASLLGSVKGYLVDYSGAWIIEGYLLLELFLQAQELITSISDRVPEGIKDFIRKELEDAGFEVLSLRLRCVVPKRYQGDAIVRPFEDVDYIHADKIVDELVRSLSKKGIDLVVHIEAKKDKSL
jgi:divalent metal cation (Fe/Co/Zn/Cd) transporter